MQTLVPALKRWALSNGARFVLRDSVGFDYGDAGGVILAADNGCVVTGAEEGMDDGGFAVVGGSQESGTHGLDLRNFPVVVRGDHGAVAIVEFKGGIKQWVGDAGAGEGRSDGAKHDDGTVAGADDEAADQDVITDADVAARAKVRQRGRAGAFEVVDFDNAVAGPVVLAGKDSGVIARRE